MITPLHNYVLVELNPTGEAKTPSGIIIQEDKKPYSKGIAKNVSPEVTGVKIGDTVVCKMNVGIKIGNGMILIKEDDIIGVEAE